MTHLMIGDLRTGRRWQEVPFTKVSWQQRRNEPETVSATVNVGDPDVLDLDMRNIAAAGKAFIAIREGDVFLGGGRLGRPTYNRDERTLDLGGRGIGDHLRSRFILPPSAATLPTTEFLIADPDVPSGTIPNPAVGTYLEGYEFGGIIVKWIEQALAWPGGDLPLVLPTAAAGTRERNVEGVEFVSLGDAIYDLTQILNGPDVAFPMEWQDDRLGVRWRLRTGTEAQPKLQSTSIHRWDLSAENTSTRGLKTTPLDVASGSLAWASGGGRADDAMVERAYDPYLVDAGFPLREILDNQHTDVSERDTLSGYAAAAAERGRMTPEVWTFETKKDASPRLGEYSVGDLCRLIINDDPIIPDSPATGYLREIAGLAGDEGDWVTVTTTEA